MTKRIAFIATNDSVPWGGSEALWQQTALRMVKTGYRIGVSVVGWQPAVPQVEALAKAGCDVHYRWYNKKPVHRLRFKVYSQETYYRWLDQFKPDLAVISQASNLDGVGWMEACLARGIPFAPISQAATPSDWPVDQLAERLATTYRQSKACFFVSKNNVELTIKQIAVSLPQAQVVRNPFKVSYTANPSWPRENEPWKLACVGRLEPASKGQDLLLEVLSADKWRKRPLQITLFGKGTRQATLVRLKKLWQLDQIHFGNYVDDIESVWASHHGLILPSRYEGLPLAVVEAMLCARLCIVTNVSGNTELLEDNVHGFVAAAPKAEYLDEALERAWQQRENWYSLGQAAAVKVRQEVPADPIGEFVKKLEVLMKP